MQNLYFYLSIFYLLLLHATCFSQTGNDSAINHKPWHKKEAVKILAAPVIFIGLGTTHIGNNGIYSSKQVQNQLQTHFGGFSTDADDFTVLAPAAGAFALALGGIKGRNNFADKTMLFLIAGGITGATTLTLKESIHIRRPDNSTYNSFPSGHTAYAFTSATFLHREYKDVSIWYSVAGYSVATATGAMRMLNNRHWMSDVLTGAGIGILSVNTTYAIYPWVKRNIFPKGSAMLIPQYGSQVKGFAFACVF